MKRHALFLGAVCLCLVAAAMISDAQARGGHKVCICHVPPGNPAAAHTICVGSPAVPAHLHHGDSLGACEQACDGKAGDTCDEDEFCKHAEGACESTAAGVCTDIPEGCPTVVAPVCGCDGITYNNSCLAALAGVNVDHRGACETPQNCGGPGGPICQAGEFCKHDVGACASDAPGVCANVPIDCPATQDPVCGCDGVTYDNACFADAAKVPVLHAGACVPGPACGGTTGMTCAEGAFCDPPVGQCAVGAEGTCTPVPTICSGDIDPVCGCDGITYNNACLADMARVAVSHTGACGGGGEEETCGGKGGATCGTGEFCKRPEGECAQTAEGECSARPTTCPPFMEPVCGCDGNDYANNCMAAAAGVTVARQGACGGEQVCGGEGMSACPDGMFCERPTAECAAAGVCVAVPTCCPVTLGEVCGCDGITYHNSCFAGAAGVTVSHDGACTTTLEKKKKKR